MKRNAWWILGYLVVFMTLASLTRCGSGVGETEPASVGVMKF